MNTHVTLFSRIAGYTVKKTLDSKSNVYSSDHVQLLVNNMNVINHTLMAAAVKLIRKAKNRKPDLDMDELTANLQDIIYLSVVSYAKRA